MTKKKENTPTKNKYQAPCTKEPRLNLERKKPPQLHKTHQNINSVGLSNSIWADWATSPGGPLKVVILLEES